MLLFLIKDVKRTSVDNRHNLGHLLTGPFLIINLFLAVQSFSVVGEAGGADPTLNWKRNQKANKSTLRLINF